VEIRMTLSIGKHIFQGDDEFLKCKQTVSGRIRRSGTTPSTAGAKKTEVGVNHPGFAPRFGTVRAGDISAGAYKRRGWSYTYSVVPCAIKLSPHNVGRVVGVPARIKSIKRVAIVTA
jgi:hypothetical protein